MKRMTLTLACLCFVLFLPTSARAYCDNFDNGNGGWEVIGGFWTADSGQYVGTGDYPHPPMQDSITVVKEFQATDMRLNVDMTSLVRVDKAVVLRFQDPYNYVKVNFRASPFNDIFVDEQAAGTLITHGSVQNPVLDCGEIPLHVEVELTGQHLRVSANGTVAIDQTFPLLAVRTGRAGLWVIDDNSCASGPCSGPDCASCPGEAQCSNGMTAFDNFCVAAAPCGDGIVQPSEQCDDGNIADGDGCDSNCTFTACGNGVVTAGEQCDDGNAVSGDGCSATCQVETGYSCTGQPSACTPICGDGLRLGSEECDDGNLIDGDGCDSNCTFTACGNGIVTAGEQCDDGNTTSGDGCSSSCQLEAGCGNGILDPGEQCDDGNAIDGDGCDSNCLSEFIPGIATPRRECVHEWLALPVPPLDRQGRPIRHVSCTDNDPTCDFGTVSGECTFHVAQCFNVTERRFACSATDVAQARLLSPSEIRPRGAIDAANRDALEAALVGVGGVVQGHRFVAFAPPLSAADTCTTFADIRVPLGRTKKLLVNAVPSAGASDVNVLWLSCKRPVITQVTFFDKGAVVPHPISTTVVVTPQSIAYSRSQDGNTIEQWAKQIESSDFSRVNQTIIDYKLLKCNDITSTGGKPACIGWQGMTITVDKRSRSHSFDILGTVCSTEWPEGVRALVALEEELVAKYR